MVTSSSPLHARLARDHAPHRARQRAARHVHGRLPAILIFVPIIHPLAVDVGIHPVHLGVVVVMTQSFGLLTPPLGMVAMTACAVAGVPMMRIQKLPRMMIRSSS